MSQLTAIRNAAADHGLEFLLIGGNAVIAYGVERETADVDFMVRREQLTGWQDLLLGLGYRVLHDGGAFLQFVPPATSVWPVDLMVVNEQTFGKLSASSRPLVLWGQEWRIPSPAHLVALKLHALKHGGKHRNLRDFLDVTGIVQQQRLDLNGPEMREMFERYGSPELYRKVLLASA